MLAPYLSPAQLSVAAAGSSNCAACLHGTLVCLCVPRPPGSATSSAPPITKARLRSQAGCMGDRKAATCKGHAVRSSRTAVAQQLLTLDIKMLARWPRVVCVPSPALTGQCSRSRRRDMNSLGTHSTLRQHLHSAGRRQTCRARYVCGLPVECRRCPHSLMS